MSRLKILISRIRPRTVCTYITNTGPEPSSWGTITFAQSSRNDIRSELRRLQKNQLHVKWYPIRWIQKKINYMSSCKTFLESCWLTEMLLLNFHIINILQYTLNYHSGALLVRLKHLVFYDFANSALLIKRLLLHTWSDGSLI